MNKCQSDILYLYLKKQSNKYKYIEMMQDQIKACTLCEKTIKGLAFYCCDVKKYVCSSCYQRKCVICDRIRTKLLKLEELGIKAPDSSSKKEKKNMCCKCKNEEVTGYRELLFEQNCKIYYCHACMVPLYSQYCNMINNLERQSGSKLQMPFQLRCGCEIQKKKIIDFMRSYCYDCSKNIDGAYTVLKNQCRIRKKCLDALKLSAQKVSYDRAKQQKAKQDWAMIQMQLVSCPSCKNILDGEKAQVGEKIGDTYICERCYRRSRQEERLYEAKSRQKDRWVQKKQQKIINHDKGVQKIPCHLCQRPFSAKDMIRQNAKEEKYLCKTCFDITQASKSSFSQKVIQSKDKFIQQAQVPKKAKKSKQDSKYKFNQNQCKICFNSEAVIMNKVCTHLILCAKCYLLCQERQGSNIIECPLCKTLGEYTEYITPIRS